jgi:TatD DNase family protein
MNAKSVDKELQHTTISTQKIEFADAHCHLDIIKDHDLVLQSINGGVLTIVTDGIDILTSRVALKIATMNKNVFAAIGIDPENALRMEISTARNNLIHSVKELKEMATSNERVVGIGEIGLDYMKAKSDAEKAKQKKVFVGMIELALELDLPVSVHSRESMNDVLEILKDKSVKKAHLHFFEGNVQQAKEAERLGYMISIPPLSSTKRTEVIKDVSIDKLMVESDAPVVGASPLYVRKAAEIVAEAKRITIERAAEQLTLNTKRFFNINAKLGFMRM